jgi:tripartite-type tricarboxylate transporter receptor subunit TctC
MLRTMMTRAAVLPSLFILALVPALAQAQSWPTRPVRIVVPFSGAGTADLLTRIVADKLSTALGEPFVVEDRPGAGGIIGQESVMRSAPDGYTLVVSSLGSFVITPAFTPLPFDPFKDFTHIAYLGGQPSVVVRWTPIAKEVAAQAKAAGMAPP